MKRILDDVQRLFLTTENGKLHRARSRLYRRRYQQTYTTRCNSFTALRSFFPPPSLMPKVCQICRICSNSENVELSPGYLEGQVAEVEAARAARPERYSLRKSARGGGGFDTPCHVNFGRLVLSCRDADFTSKYLVIILQQ